ncbi:hypothetical protein ACJX0J_028549, partial [Zea mays]
DSRRKFIWEEMSYLERWWRDATPKMREAFAKLVRDGQLEIVSGGWVMNDEANSHYFAIIEQQMMEGNMWLNDTIGVIPKNSWRMGFHNMLIQRTHYESTLMEEAEILGSFLKIMAVEGHWFKKPILFQRQSGDDGRGLGQGVMDNNWGRASKSVLHYMHIEQYIHLFLIFILLYAASSSVTKIK